MWDLLNPDCYQRNGFSKGTILVLFSERIIKRWRHWWAPPQSFGVSACKERIHRLKERYAVRNGNDAESDWQCCEFWQRTLIYKWNAREFAQKHGCRVPSLYWFGRKLSTLPFESLPDCYVVKPNLGFSRNHVYVMARGTDLLRNESYTNAQLTETLREVTRGILGVPVLVEEFVKDEQGEHKLPTEYKCHLFGEKIAAIQVIQRMDNVRAKHRYYTENWEMFEDPMSTILPLDDIRRPPRCLDEMRASARTLGKAYGTYVRADFYASEAGCVFGEFSSTPSLGETFTPYANHYFGALWQETFGEKI